MEWIKCSDKLPEDKEVVIIYRPKKALECKMLIHLFSEEDCDFTCPDGYCGIKEIKDVTHWMPIPQTPND